MFRSGWSLVRQLEWVLQTASEGMNPACFRLLERGKAIAVLNPGTVP
jgi:hypothetical protein